MAIDLVGDVMRDIQRMYKSTKFTAGVVRPAVDAHAKKMLDLTEQSKNPQGRPYQSLSRGYANKKKNLGQPPVPNLRLGNKSPKTMDTLYSTVEGSGGKIGFKKDQSLSNKKRYMHKHQYGKDGMPKRKVFPEEGDVKVGASASVVAQVKRVLLDYLMTPRQIKGTVRG